MTILIIAKRTIYNTLKQTKAVKYCSSSAGYNFLHINCCFLRDILINETMQSYYEQNMTQRIDCIHKWSQLHSHGISCSLPWKLWKIRWLYRTYWNSWNIKNLFKNSYLNYLTLGYLNEILHNTYLLTWLYTFILLWNNLIKNVFLIFW